MTVDDPKPSSAGRHRARHERRSRTHTPSSAALLQSPSQGQGQDAARRTARRADRRDRSGQGGILQALLAALGLGRKRSDSF